jgi:hypothetical protein
MLSRLATSAPVLLALLGGVYFGLSSCGGYAWHQTVFTWVLFAGTVMWLLLPRTKQQPAGFRILVVLLAPLAFVIAEAAFAPFYPSGPDSVGTFVRSLFRALEYGAC